MEKWEYKIIEFECSGHVLPIPKIQTYVDYVKATSWTGKEKAKAVRKPISNSKEIEVLFNNLGRGGWKLVGILPLLGTAGFISTTGTARIHIIFKRKVSK